MYIVYISIIYSNDDDIIYKNSWQENHNAQKLAVLQKNHF
jgi:hypothetical protein